MSGDMSDRVSDDGSHQAPQKRETMRARWPKAVLALAALGATLGLLAPSASAIGAVPTPLWYSNQNSCQTRLGKNAPCDTAYNVSACSNSSAMDVPVTSQGAALEDKLFSNNGNTLGGYADRSVGLGQALGFQCTYNDYGSQLEDGFAASGANVWHFWFDGSGYHQGDLGQPSGHTITSTGAVWYDANHLQVHVSDDIGNTWVRIYTQNVGWSNWFSEWANGVAPRNVSAVTACTPSPGNEDVFISEQGTHILYHMWLINGVWAGWQNMGIYTRGISCHGFGDSFGSIANRLDLAVIGQDNGVYHEYILNGAASGWGASLAGAAGGTWGIGGTWTQWGTYDIFFTNNNPYTGVFHVWWTPTGWSPACYEGDMGGAESPVNCSAPYPTNP